MASGRLCLLVVVFAGSLLGGLLHAAELPVGLIDYPPFVIVSEGRVDGLYPAILARISEMTGDRFRHELLPTRRLLAMFNDGQLAVEIGTNPRWRADQDERGLYSRPFMQSVDVVVFQQGKRVSVRDWHDLQGLRLGVIGGFHYPGFSEHFDAGLIEVYFGGRESQLLAMLLANRLDAVLINRAVFSWLQVQRAQTSDLVVGDVVGRVPVMFRIHPDYGEAIPRINAALEQMQDSGELRDLLSRYGLSDSAIGAEADGSKNQNNRQEDAHDG